jgi:hypothetical protein
MSEINKQADDFNPQPSADVPPPAEAPLPEPTPSDPAPPADTLAVSEENKAEAESAAPENETQAVQQGDARPADPVDADDVLTRKLTGREAADAAVLAQSKFHTRRSFLVAAAATAAGVGFYKWLDLQPSDEMQPNLLRRAFQSNATVSRELTREHVLAPTYPLDKAETLRVNGVYGLKMELIPESWRLQLVGVREDQHRPAYVQDVTAWNYRYAESKSKEDQGHDTKVDPNITSAIKMAPESMTEKAQQDENRTGRKPRGLEESGESESTLAPNTSGLLLTMEDILKFPRHELVTQFKCIEGWSQIVHWAGIRLSDFLEAYPPALIDGKEPKYVYMETPDGDYYNGYDLNACRHPQALLVTEMMGAPLTQFHGAPLRLHMPTKYGYKQIKRIGLISYTNDKPDDYWTKLGYDWYGGL